MKITTKILEDTPSNLLWYNNCIQKDGILEHDDELKCSKKLDIYLIKNREKIGGGGRLIDRLCKKHFNYLIENGYEIIELSEKDIFYLRLIGKYCNLKGK